MLLSALDQCHIREGGTAAQALSESVQLARHVDALGYHRFWIAEHHDSPEIASAAPEVMIGHIAAQTSRIRVGPGGVMLTHYSALKVAEQFRTLEALFPGRIDLGVGRAPAGNEEYVAALAAGPGAASLEAYPRQVSDLVHYLADNMPSEHPFADVHVMARGDTVPEVWCLGSSLGSAQIAGMLGLPFSFAQFINTQDGPRAVALYRKSFRPSQWLAEPRVSVAVNAICAPTEEEAVRMSLSWYRMRFYHCPVPSVETAHGFDYPEPERNFIEFARSQVALGDPQQARARLEQFAAEFTTDELLLLTVAYDFATRVRSYKLIADEFGLERSAAGATPEKQSASISSSRPHVRRRRVP